MSHITPRKLTCPLKITGWKMYFLLKRLLFRGHVSFPGCRPGENSPCFAHRQICRRIFQWIPGSSVLSLGGGISNIFLNFHPQKPWGFMESNLTEAHIFLETGGEKSPTTLPEVPENRPLEKEIPNLETTIF